jgi:hypothetical protein
MSAQNGAWAKANFANISTVSGEHMDFIGVIERCHREQDAASCGKGRRSDDARPSVDWSRRTRNSEPNRHGPVKDGLVVAADSRASFSGQYCDHQFKILEPEHLARTIVATAGLLEVQSGRLTPSSNLCEYMSASRRVLDVQAVVLDSLERSGAKTGLDVDIYALASRCTEAVRDAKLHGTWLNDRRQILFGIVIATYEDRVAEARGFTIAIDEHLAPVIRTTLELEATEDEQGRIWAFGDTETYNRAVQQKQYLSDATRQFVIARKPAKDTTVQEAAAAAVDLINAAARVSAITRPPGNIGGPIDVVLLGAEPRPRRLQWKQ